MIPKSLPLGLDPGVVFRFSDKIMRKKTSSRIRMQKAPRDFRGAFLIRKDQTARIGGNAHMLPCPRLMVWRIIGAVT
jgi:hypothetical protein